MARQPKLKPSQQLTEDFIERARTHVGYKALTNKVTEFGQRLNLNGLPWDGTFIEVVLRDTGIRKLMSQTGRPRLPSMTYTPTALSFFVKTARLYTKPQRGDIAFFDFSTDDDFGMPHVGIVTDVKDNGMFMCIEGMVDSGSPRGDQSNNGVHERERSIIETVGFGRIDFKKAASVSRVKLKTDNGEPAPKRVTVGLAHARLGSTHKNVETIQLALNTVTGVEGMQRGKFCRRTRLAFAKYQRMLGYPNSSATGIPDATSLKELGASTGLYDFKA